MQRRDFVFSLFAGTAGAAGALPGIARAAEADATEAAFQSQRAAEPWTLGYEGLQADVAPMARPQAQASSSPPSQGKRYGCMRGGTPRQKQKNRAGARFFRCSLDSR